MKRMGRITSGRNAWLAEFFYNGITYSDRAHSKVYALYPGFSESGHCSLLSFLCLRIARVRKKTNIFVFLKLEYQIRKGASMDLPYSFGVWLTFW